MTLCSNAVIGERDNITLEKLGLCLFTSLPPRRLRDRLCRQLFSFFFLPFLLFCFIGEPGASPPPPAKNTHNIQSWKCSATLNSASSEHNLWKIGSEKQSWRNDGEQNRRNVKEALVLLPTRRGLKKARPKQISGAEGRRERAVHATVQANFYVFCREGHKPERFQTVTQDRGVLKVNLSPSILRGSIVLSCCCHFMDFWNTSPQPLSFLFLFFSFQGGEGGVIN